MSKVLKVYVKTSKDIQEMQIYCIRVDLGDLLQTFKQKVYIRAPLLADKDPEIYWFDAENDKIKITCDDDWRFFLCNELVVKKVYCDFQPPTEEARKRSSSQLDDEATESSKRIRKQLEEIDLSYSSESSSDMDADDEDLIPSPDTSKESSVAINTQEELVPCTSKQAQEQLTSERQKINIISIDVIAPADETIEIADDTEAADKGVQADNPQDEVQEAGCIVTDESKFASKEDDLIQQSQSQKKSRRESNRIVISDSSDSDDDANCPRRNSAFASSYSFANINNEGSRFESRGHCRRGPYRYRQHHSSENLRDLHNRVHAEAAQHIRHAHETARQAQRQAAQALRASATIIPDMVSNFRAHFQRPMFNVADINQQLFHGPFFGRR